MRAIIVCGSRRLTTDEPVVLALSGERGTTIAIHGDAEGADTIAAKWLTKWGLRVIAMPAQWDRDGNKAGPIRNAHMLDVLLALRACGYDVAVYAFPCPESKGTWDMVRRANIANVPVFVHRVAP